LKRCSCSETLLHHGDFFHDYLRNIFVLGYASYAAHISK